MVMTAVLVRLKPVHFPLSPSLRWGANVLMGSPVWQHQEPAFPHTQHRFTEQCSQGTLTLGTAEADGGGPVQAGVDSTEGIRTLATEQIAVEGAWPGGGHLWGGNSCP